MLLEEKEEFIEEEKIAYIDQYADEFDEKTIGVDRAKPIKNFLKMLDMEDFFDTEDEDELLKRQIYYEESLNLVFNMIYCTKKHYNQLNLPLILRLIEEFYNPDQFEEFYLKVKEIYGKIFHGADALMKDAIDFFWPIVFSAKSLPKFRQTRILWPQLPENSPVPIIIEKSFKFGFIDQTELDKLYKNKDDTYLYLKYRLSEKHGDKILEENLN